MLTPQQLHQYAILEEIDRERDFELRKAFFEAGERSADRRAGLVAAMVLNVNRADEHAKLWSAEDFFPHLKHAANDDAESEAGAMDTQESVRFLQAGFGLFLPAQYRESHGL